MLNKGLTPSLWCYLEVFNLQAVELVGGKWSQLEDRDAGFPFLSVLPSGPGVNSILPHPHPHCNPPCHRRKHNRSVIVLWNKPIGLERHWSFLLLNCFKYLIRMMGGQRSHQFGNSSYTPCPHFKQISLVFPVDMISAVECKSRTVSWVCSRTVIWIYPRPVSWMCPGTVSGYSQVCSRILSWMSSRTVIWVCSRIVSWVCPRTLSWACSRAATWIYILEQLVAF